MSAKLIIDAIGTKLAASQVAGTFYHALGGRIYQGMAVDGATKPHCVYQINQNPVIRYFGGVVAQDMTVQFDIFDDRRERGYAGAIAAEALLYSLLDGFALTITGYDRGLCTWNSRGVPQIEEDCWRITNELRVEATDF